MVPKNDPKNLNVFIIFGGLRIFDHQLCFILELFSWMFGQRTKSQKVIGTTEW